MATLDLRDGTRRESEEKGGIERVRRARRPIVRLRLGTSTLSRREGRRRGSVPLSAQE